MTPPAPPEPHAVELFERDHELRALDEAMNAAERGHGNLVVIDGPAGIGKSSLAAAATASARARGIQVLTARGAELERDAPFGVAMELLAGRVAAAPERERARLLAGPAGPAASVLERGAPAEAQAVIRALYWLCLNLTGMSGSAPKPQPLLVVVDDVQWADHASLAFLAYLAGRIEELPILLVVAVRTGDARVTDDALDWIYTNPVAQVLKPAVLTEDGVTRVVEKEFPGAEPGFVHACAHVSGGNPFFASELARALREDGVIPTAAAVAQVERLVPESVLHSVLVRVARLGDEAQRIAAAVAVLGDGADMRHAAALGDLDASTAEAGADALARAHILGPGSPLRFTHPLIATAVASDLPAFARARAHRRAADLLAADHAPVERIAAHLLLSRPDGDERTVQTLREAAVRVLAHGDPSAAVRLLRRALAEPAPRPQRGGLLVELAAAQLAQGDTDAEHTLDEALRVIDDEPERVRALTVLARFRFNRGERAAAVEAYDEALAATQPGEPAAAQLFAEYLTAHTFEARLHPAGNARLKPIIEAAGRGELPTDPGLLAHVALRTAFDGGRPEQVRSLAERSTAQDPFVDPGTHGFLMGMVVQALVAVDELDAAERICDAAMTAARRRGVLLGYTLASYHRAIARHHMGALVGALGDLDQALTATQEGWSGGAWVYAQQVHTLLERGETLAARDAIAHAYAEAGSMGYAVVAFARARLALAERDAALARLTALDAGRQLSEDFGIDHPGFIPWRDVAALATQALGDRDEAARLAREALDRARWCGVPRVISRSLRTASAVADGQLRVDYLTEARSLIEGSPSLLERAHCLVELGAALRMSGQPTAAQPPLREGLQLADAIGAVPLADRAGAELRVTGVRPRRAAYTGVDALTPAERRVAELAATGLTNAQIAQDLFVTMKTVQTHLAHTYRKLGIESRRDLAGAFGAHRAGTRG